MTGRTGERATRRVDSTVDRRSPALASGGVAGEEITRRRTLRAQARRRSRSSSSVRPTASLASVDARPTVSMARLLKLHALGPHCEIEKAGTSQRSSLSLEDQQLITNVTALCGPVGNLCRDASTSGRPTSKSSPRAASNDGGPATPVSRHHLGGNDHRSTYRSWVPPDLAHEAFMRSVHRERANFGKFAEEESARRDSVWLGWHKPVVKPKKMRFLTKAEEIRESLRRPKGRGFDGTPWDPTEGFSPDEVQLDPQRAETLLARTRASTIGYCYDHQNYV